MLRFAAVLALVAAGAAVPAGAQTPAPHASGAYVHRVPVTTSLTNPSGKKTLPAMSGAGCNTGTMAMRSQNTINPITGQPQAATFVSIPLNKGGGSVASATNRAQQTQACAHATH